MESSGESYFLNASLRRMETTAALRRIACRSAEVLNEEGRLPHDGKRPMRTD